MWFAYLFGILVNTLLNKGEFKNKAINIYQLLFFTGATYMLMCYAFMTYHNYTYLLAPDIAGYFYRGQKTTSMKAVIGQH